MIYLDTETRSDIDIKKSNVYRYVESPSFSILMMAFAHNDEPVEVVTDPLDIRRLFLQWVDDGDTFVAHNAAFDRVALSKFCGLNGYHDPKYWIDPAVWAAEAGYPRKLELLAKALKTEMKDAAGTALINWFSKPQKDGTYRQPEDHPEKWADFVRYCGTDVEAMRDAMAHLPAPTATEHDLWVACERINDRGMEIDVELATAGVKALATNISQGKAQLTDLLGVENGNSLQQFTAALAETGLALPNMRAETIEKVLDEWDLTEDQRQALEIRQDIAGSAAKKYAAALYGVCADNRIRGAFKFYGASTGRWSGSGAQPQNLPRAAVKASIVDVADRMLETGESEKAAQLECDIAEVEARIASLKRTDQTDPYTLKALVRPMFTGPKTVADFSSIEARVLAWLAGEEWALEAFALGRDIYTETARRMGPQFGRQQGKAATLGLGYNGGVNALRNVGMSGFDDELLPIVDSWRASNPKIVRFWWDLFDAWKDGGRVGPVRINASTGTREMVLPSGRSVWYRGVKYEKYWVEDPITTEKKSKEGWRYNRASGGRVRLWSGLCTENLIQAVARDLLANALLELEAEGLPVIAHVHDEVWIDGIHDPQEIENIICRAPAWAKGLPLSAEGWCGVRYRK